METIDKKTSASLLFLIFLVGTLPLGVILVGRRIRPPRAAELPSPIFFVPEDGEREVDGEFTVNVAVNTEGTVVDGLDVLIEAVNLEIKEVVKAGLPGGLFFAKDPEIVGSRVSFSVLADPVDRFKNNEAQTLVSLTVSGKAHCAESKLVFNKDLSVVASGGKNILGIPQEASFSIQSPPGVTNPSFTSATTATTKAGQPFSYAAVATNPNNGTLVYSYSNLPDWLVAAGAMINGTPPAIGTATVGIIVQDGRGGSACHSLTISVLSQLGATLALSPETSVFSVGSTFNTEVKLNTNGAKVKGTDVRLVYDPSYLRAVEIIPKTDIFPDFPIKTIDAASGKISVSATSAEGSFYSNNSPVQIAALRFTALKQGTTKVEFEFVLHNTTDSNVVEYGTNVDILEMVTNGTYNLRFSTKVLHVDLQMEGRSSNKNNYPVVLKAKDSSWRASFVPNPDGYYPVFLENFPEGKTGMVEFLLKGYQHLQVKRGVEITADGKEFFADFGILPAGDIAPLSNLDNYVNVIDFSVLVSEWNLEGPEDSIGDLNADLYVNSIDYSIMVNNFHREGES